MVSLTPGHPAFKAMPFFWAVVATLICCIGVASVRSPLHYLRLVIFITTKSCLAPPRPSLQASLRVCPDIQYTLQLVNIPGFEEKLLVHIRRASNSSALGSDDAVDFSACNVTLRGITGRSNGRFAPYHIGASPTIFEHS